jgi:Fe-S oxidoreductase
VRERIIEGYHPFVLPFTIALALVMIFLGVALIRLIANLPRRERIKLFRLFNPGILLKTIKDIIADSLIHVKIFKRNLLLGYMHSSIAFGWFMLILVGHIEVMIYTPHRTGILYYPVFFRFFVMETQETLRGAFFFFLMDFFLLVVLSGVTLAIIKRFRSMLLGMRRTTKLSLADRIAMYSLWMIFPLRLLAESFTANISGGSFLTRTINIALKTFVSNPENVLPVWWAYSASIALFLLVLPFTRYMHIPTEIILIALRNAGIKPHSSRGGYADAEIYSCSSCGICIDACPMSVKKRNLKYSSVYFIRFLRRFNGKEKEAAEKCLMCGKCVELCPVGIDSCRLKRLRREEYSAGSPVRSFSYLPEKIFPSEYKKEKILYYSGCMTSLTPSIIKSVKNILVRSGVEFVHLDSEKEICCGRPLILAGRKADTLKLIEANTKEIVAHKPSVLLLSCPICYKVFKEEYKLRGIEILHHTQYFEKLLKSGQIKMKLTDEIFAYHDPCELGRGSGIYDEPRMVLKFTGILSTEGKQRNESICCGGSLGSLSLNKKERDAITKYSAEELTGGCDTLVTACPLCLKTFTPHSPVPVKDIAQVVEENLI